MTDQPPGFEGDAASKTAPKAASNERLQQRVATAARAVRLRLGPNAIAAAQRGEPIILNLNEADDLAVAVLTELGRELDAFAEYENTINWMTTCTSCARVLDSSIRETERAERAEAELAALRTVARGYCPACGRGDAAPSVEDWEQQKQRADQAEQQRNRLAATLDAALTCMELHWARSDFHGPTDEAVTPEHFKTWRAALDQNRRQP